MNREKSKLFIIAVAVLAISLIATSASAAVTNVSCVPWQGSQLASHWTWDGKVILLKAVVTADNTAAITTTQNTCQYDVFTSFIVEPSQPSVF